MTKEESDMDIKYVLTHEEICQAVAEYLHGLGILAHIEASEIEVSLAESGDHDDQYDDLVAIVTESKDTMDDEDEDDDNDDDADNEEEEEDGESGDEKDNEKEDGGAAEENKEESSSSDKKPLGEWK